MKKIGGLSACGILLFALTPAVWSAATPEEAKALVEEAIVFYQSHGREKAVAEFSRAKGDFVRGDLYIFAFDPAGTVIAHGGDPELVGQDLSDVQDPDGVFFGREFIKIGPEGGWVDYKWMNYKTNKVEAKSAYLKRIDDVIIGCGAYK